MSKFKPMEIRSIAYFNPPEKIAEGYVAKKIPMGCLKEFQRKIIGYEFSEYNSGPKFRNGDVLVAKITPCLENGKTAFVDILENDEVAFGSSEFIVLRAKPNTNNEFLYYLARSPSFRKKAIGCMEGTSGRKRVNENALKLYEHPIPDKGTQIKIANVLSALDAKIELNNRINAELEAMAKTLYDYWFVQFNFPFDFAQGKPAANGKPYKSSGGKMEYNTTLKREIPEGWGSKKLETVTSTIRRGISPKYAEDGGFPVLNQKCIRDQRIQFGDCRYHSTELPNNDERLLRLYDVLVNSTGVGTLGRVAFVKRLLEANTTVDSHVTIVRADSREISPEYLAWSMLRYQSVIESAANGSTGQVELNKSFVEDLDIVIAEETVQKSFSTFLEPLVKEIAIREREVEFFTQLRDWLLPMLMNGQVTVK